MTPEERQKLKAHVSEIAKILHADAIEKGMSMSSLGEIEQAVRSQLQSYVSPDVGIFLSQQERKKTQENPEN